MKPHLSFVWPLFGLGILAIVASAGAGAAAAKWLVAVAMVFSALPMAGAQTGSYRPARTATPKAGLPQSGITKPGAKQVGPGTFSKSVFSFNPTPPTQALLPAPPKITRTSPAIGATDVDLATTAIMVTFDRPMSKGMSWSGGAAELPRAPEGQKPSWADSYTCVFPVRLDAAHLYRVGINANSQDFRSMQGVAAPPASIYFVTVGANDALKAKVKKPVIVKMEPPNGTKDVNPKTAELRVTFDAPMADGSAWCGSGLDFPLIPEGKKATWNADHKTVILPVELKPHWGYKLSLNSPSKKDFATRAGVPLDPVEYSFTTAKESK